MEIWLYSLLSVIIVSCISFIGVLTLAINRQKIQKITIWLVSLAAGAILGDVFIHILPEAFKEEGAGLQVSLLVIFGIILFFILEKFIHWRHCHVQSSENHTHPVVAMNLVGDGVHNFIDGIIIGASYLVNIPLGIATTIAVILHEIPQEIGDFGILVHGGLGNKRALIFNFFSALVAVSGTVIALLIGPVIENFNLIMLPIIAGGFLYIASSDLIPELHKSCDSKPSESLGQILFMLLGVLAMALLIFIEI